MRVETGQVKLEGENLDRILDVTVGGRALGDASYSKVKNAYGGVLPSLAQGEHPVMLRLRDCTDVITGLTLPVP